MSESASDDEFLLAVLNSTPVIAGEPADLFDDADGTRSWLAGLGGAGTTAELRALTRVRALLQAVIRGQQPAAVLAAELAGTSRVPAIADGRLEWSLRVPPERQPALRAILAWDQLSRLGRLRPCANPDCRRFLIDRSKPNTARWCSMAVCGNRMKARRHYQRSRDGVTP